MRRSAAAVAVLAVVAAGCGAQERDGGGGKPDAPDKPRAAGLSWAYERIDEVDGELIDGAVMAPDDIWAVGSDGAGTDGRFARGHLLHFDGEKWSRKPMPVEGDPALSRLESLGSAGIRLSTVEGTSSARGKPRHALWDGTRWGPVKNAPAGPLTHVEVIAPDDVWVLQGDGKVTHWDGRRWTVTPMPAKRIVALAGSAPDDVWAVGSRTTGPGIGGAGGQVSQPAAMRYDGEKWTLTKTPTMRFPAPVPPEPFAGFTEIDVASKTYALAVGQHSFKGYDAEENPDPRPSSFALRWNGSRWTEAEPFPGACAYRRPVTRDGDGGFFMDGNWHLAADGACTKIGKPRLPATGGVRPESEQQLWLKRIVPVPGTDKVIGFGTVDVLQSGPPASKAVVVTLKR
ncbi:hypothetical protein GKQ77_04955 [Streptomyces sp. BG9H]|uniref:Uncharacterized protein n=1 Tax=Streptomyces anatolicus TaxID=2675858 RepID=A0ABS6YHQ4_9ACTN|nr:hypothetical protein [Streptomyces anatolicus]MBW5420920.1 hypothetical protein [Streptomyces anatolicus]